MTELGSSFGDLQLAARHHVPRQVTPRVPMPLECLVVPLLVYLLLAALSGFGLVTLPFLPVLWKGVLWTLLGAAIVFNLLHKLQRGVPPAELDARAINLDQVVLWAQGDHLRVSGLASPYRVSQGRFPLRGLTVQVAETGPDRWRLLLTPEGQKCLPLMDIISTPEQIQDLVARLSERVAQASERHGSGEAEIPSMLQKLSES